MQRAALSERVCLISHAGREYDPSICQRLPPRPVLLSADLNPAFSGYLSAAHGQRDEARRECYNFVLDFPGGKPTYRVFAISDPPAGAGAAGAGAADGDAAAAAAEGGGGTSAPLGRVLATIEAPAAYIHRCGCRGEAAAVQGGRRLAVRCPGHAALTRVPASQLTAPALQCCFLPCISCRAALP